MSNRFSNQNSQFTDRYGLKDSEDECLEDASAESEETTTVNRRSTSEYLKGKRLCFICNLYLASDDKPYNQGGLTRCTDEKAGKRLQERREIFLKDKQYRFNSATSRLFLLESGPCRDLYAIDVYYHQSCYIKFALAPTTKKEQQVQRLKERANDVQGLFFTAIRKNIVHQVMD